MGTILDLVDAAYTPTPETDAAIRVSVYGDVRCDIDVARRLERERDEARESLRRCHDEYICTAHDREAEMEAIKGERDRYRKAIEEALHVLEMPRAGQYAKNIDASVAKTWLENALAGNEVTNVQ